MKRLAFTLVALVLFGFAACNRAPVRLEGKKGVATTKDPWVAFVDTVRYSETMSAGDEWTRFRGGFDLLNSHFTKPDVVKNIRDLATENRKFLESEVHLTQDELDEVESPSFRAADAHYLDECFLLRDAARSLEVGDITTLQQAQNMFGWVVRNILPCEQGDSWTPPAFTLRRGHGGPLERSLVFLALLRQARIEGCLIVVPEKDAEPKRFLVAVLDATSSQMHLFDLSLGLPLMSKDGTSVLTLKDALQTPALLTPSLITLEQAKTLEAWLVCPLYAMAPRLLEAEKGLRQKGAGVLHLDAPQLLKDIKKATDRPVKIWNPPAAGPTLPNSPTRSLRLFLTKQEGGIDETNRAALAARARMPLANVLSNYAQIKFTDQLLPRTSFEIMNKLTQIFFSKYDLQPREMYLRGEYQMMIGRQERLKHFAEDNLLVNLVNDAKFRDELVDWQKQMTRANADADNPDAKVRAKAQQDMQALWMRDQFVGWMVEVTKEEKHDHRYEKTVVTRVLAVGMREYFEIELARSQAATSHERAEITQTLLRTQQSPTEKAKAASRVEWKTAYSAWQRLYLDRIVLDARIDRQLKQIQMVPFDDRPGRELDQIDNRIRLLETLHQDIHKYFQAKLRVAECLEHVEGTKAAHAYLQTVKREVEALEKKDLVQPMIKALSGERLALDRPFFQKQRLALLARDWSEQGSFFWLKQQIDRRIRTP